MHVKKVPHEAAAAGFGKSAKCETSWWNPVRFNSDGYTLSTSRLPHLTAGVLALAVAKAGACCLSPHSPTSQTGRNCPYQHLLLFPLLLGQTALGEGTADMGEVKRYRLLLFSSAEPICQGL